MASLQRYRVTGSQPVNLGTYGDIQPGGTVWGNPHSALAALLVQMGALTPEDEPPVIVTVGPARVDRLYVGGVEQAILSSWDTTTKPPRA